MDDQRQSGAALSQVDFEAMRQLLKEQQMLDMFLEDRSDEYQEYLQLVKDSLLDSQPAPAPEAPAALPQAAAPSAALPPAMPAAMPAALLPAPVAAPMAAPSTAPGRPGPNGTVIVPLPPQVRSFNRTVTKPKDTSLMVRNIPNRFQPHQLRRLLGQLGLAGTFDYFYVPMNKKRGLNLGYFFIKFLTTEAAENCRARFHGLRLGTDQSKKVVEVTLARDQGAAAQQTNRQLHKQASAASSSS